MRFNTWPRNQYTRWGGGRYTGRGGGMYKGAQMVEMIAAALYAFAEAGGHAVAYFAYVTNTMATRDQDFEEGPGKRCSAGAHHHLYDRASVGGVS